MLLLIQMSTKLIDPPPPHLPIGHRSGDILSDTRYCGYYGSCAAPLFRISWKIGNFDNPEPSWTFATFAEKITQHNHTTIDNLNPAAKWKWS